MGSRFQSEILYQKKQRKWLLRNDTQDWFNNTCNHKYVHPYTTNKYVKSQYLINIPGYFFLFSISTLKITTAWQNKTCSPTWYQKQKRKLLLLCPKLQPKQRPRRQCWKAPIATKGRPTHHPPSGSPRPLKKLTQEKHFDHYAIIQCLQPLSQPWRKQKTTHFCLLWVSWPASCRSHRL